MNTTRASWYAFGDEGSTGLRCAACRAAIDLGGPQLDHHPATCPRCGVGCAFLNWKGRVLQIIPADAPSVVRRLLTFMQEQFDELEYVELVVAIQDLMDDLSPTCQTGAALGPNGTFAPGTSQSV